MICMSVIFIYIYIYIYTYIYIRVFGSWRVTTVWLAQKHIMWRHNGRDAVSNHKPHDCLSNRIYSGPDKKKHQSYASLASMRGIHRWPVNSLNKWPVTRKMFPFDDVIMTSKANNYRTVDIHVQTLSQYICNECTIHKTVRIPTANTLLIKATCYTLIMLNMT